MLLYDLLFQVSNYCIFSQRIRLHTEVVLAGKILGGHDPGEKGEKGGLLTCKAKRHKES